MFTRAALAATSSLRTLRPGVDGLLQMSLAGQGGYGGAIFAVAGRAFIGLHSLYLQSP